MGHGYTLNEIERDREREVLQSRLPYGCDVRACNKVKLFIIANFTFDDLIRNESHLI